MPPLSGICLAIAGAQKGAVLVVSLIMLLLMTLLGVTALQTITLEEKMAGNMRDRSLAFQAAESALRAGEIFLSQATLPVFNCANGLYKANASGTNCATATPDLWASVDWTSSNVTTYSGTLSGVANNPAYIVEEFSAASASASGGSLEAGTVYTSGVPNTYRITARGTGGTASSVVILQSTFKR
ncbi:pilus assembly protein PilX [Methylococcus sp. EFPC2]|nr:pilus assembly protein PilX [Methylococcus sp. EFPC2]